MEPQTFAELTPAERGHVLSLYEAAGHRSRLATDEGRATWWALRQYIVGTGPRPDIKAIEEQERTHMRELFLEDEVTA